GQSFQNGPTQGDGVFIPMEWIIGGREQIGQGWRMLMDSLAAGRAISLPALGTGAAMFCARYAGAYARIRRQFGIPIGRFEGVQEPLARIAAYAYSLDAARKLTAASLDAGEQPSVLSAILKYHATEKMRTALNDALDIHGGGGVCDGPSN
ncbi:MAG: acyl-CoA dehydrogenase family protein, partial [Alphaproteobacteria bacterium]